MDNIFSCDVSELRSEKVYKRKPVENPAAVIEADPLLCKTDRAEHFAAEIRENIIGDFEKTGTDKMCHVSTFCFSDGNIYMSYYANTDSAEENPGYQTARLCYALQSEPSNKTYIDIMKTGETLCGHKVTGVYDTILMQKDDEPDNIYVLWTASIDYKYYRLYRIFNIKSGDLSDVRVNRFKVGSIVNDFSSSGMQNALALNGIGYKEFFSDIGIMQKLSSRIENGVKYYYTGTYSGNFTAIIKSKDLITWEYVAQPDEGANGTGFGNETKWENAVYVLNDKVFYFVRQWDFDAKENTGSKYGILTYFNLKTSEWSRPVLIGDCQSRSDFIVFKGTLYLFHAPIDREHIGIVKIDTDDISKSEIVLQADIKGSCFYPFVQYTGSGGLCMSYTVSRKHIRLASFDFEKYTV